MGYALRYFYEQMLEPHVAAAGSLVEFALGQISIPVGRIDYVTMRPMTFVEHLWAIGNDVMAGGLCLQTAYARQDAPTQSYRDDLVATPPSSPSRDCLTAATVADHASSPLPGLKS
jgi:hypothetical protein